MAYDIKIGALKRFLRTIMAGCLPLAVQFFGVYQFSQPELIFASAVLLALDKLFRSKGWY